MNYNDLIKVGLEEDDHSMYLRNLIGITLPVILFIFQLWICIQLDYSRLIWVYTSFLAFYFLGALLACNFKVTRNYDSHLSARFLSVSKVFICLKAVVVFYYLLIFLEYYMANGYLNVRGYLVSDAIKGSIFYSALMMYIDAYIFVPLNYIFLAIFFVAKQKKYALTLLLLIVIQYGVIFASRGVFYQLAILLLAYMLHKRTSLFKIVIRFAPVIFTITCISLLLISVRDTSTEKFSTEEAFISTTVVYHLISPTILNELIETSNFFKSNTGFGLATFGFIADPITYIFTNGAKDYMFSKTLSEEAQSFTLHINATGDYNAFATFLFAALFDFGSLGPCLYGIFFGFLIGYSYNRRDVVGRVYYVIGFFYVYFNSFNFFITGDWFFALLIAPMAWHRLRNGLPKKSSFPKVALNLRE